MKAIAEDKEKRADKDAKDAAAAYRNLASIARVSDPGRARDYYARAARLNPSDVDGMLQNGWFQQQAGQLDAAYAAYARVIAAAKPGADDKDLVWAKFGMGDIAQQRGDLGAALATYREAETITDRLAKTDPGNAGWQLHEFRQPIDRERAFILSGSCSPNGQQTPFLPFIELVRGSRPHDGRLHDGDRSSADRALAPVDSGRNEDKRDGNHFRCATARRRRDRV